MARRKDSPQKAAMREMMRDYLKNNDISIKDGTDVNSIMRTFITKFPNVVIGLFAVVIFVVFDVVSNAKNDVIMNVFFVNMGGNNIRIFSL